MMSITTKPIIGFTCGDLNGIGIELILKSLADHRILELCTPVVFASSKALNYYRKIVTDTNISYYLVKDFAKLNTKQVNLFICWEEDVKISPGELTKEGGNYALLSLRQATQALKLHQINALVTAPIHKKNIQSDSFKHIGHTPYFKEIFGVHDVLMFMVDDQIKVGLVTEHLPLQEVAKHITKDNILRKLKILHDSLEKDFAISHPKIAVLGLNPHAGDEGTIGKEENEQIKPAIQKAKETMLVFGPYSADAFFAHNEYAKFDAVLAMYHDQALIPFKSIATRGVNYTAGLTVVRTSPDHGTAFDIAGKGIADTTSFFAAIFTAIDICNARNNFVENHSNQLSPTARTVVVQDENIKE